MDEQQTQNEQTVYEVVPYGDVRDVAVDAASEALEAQERVTADDLASVAESAATDAAQQVAQDSHDVLRTDGNAIAEKAAQGAVSGVQEALDEQLKAIEQRSADVTTVALDAEQYQFIHDSMVLQNTVQMFALVVLMALLGAKVTGYFLQRWK